MQIERTISTIFFVPLLKINSEDLNIEKHGFLNAYQFIKGEENPNLDEIYLLFKPSNQERFNEFIDGEYWKSDRIIEDYDISEGFIVLVYKLDPKYKDDFDLIRQGKYSKTSHEFQSLFSRIKKIMRNGLYKDEVSIQYKIFTKAEDLKNYWEDRVGQSFKEDMEVWSGWNSQKETLDINVIKELLK